MRSGYRDAPGKMKQFATWFTHGVANGSHLRKAIYECHEAAQILDAVQQFFEKLLAAPEHAGAARAAAGSAT